MLEKDLRIIILSDGTGETAASLCKATLTQFPESQVMFTRYKNIRTTAQIEAILNEAALHHDLVTHTIVQTKLRQKVIELCESLGIRHLDLIGNAIKEFSEYFNMQPEAEPGLLHAVNQDYFDKVSAMEFTLEHDDGKNIHAIDDADIILLGVSRTSKTPLSVYLSQHGLRVINIPIINQTPLPEKLYEIDQRKIFALTIDPEALIEIRRKRLIRLGAKEHLGDYASEDKIVEEIDWAMNIFKKNKRWPIFNVTNKALEETASDILKLINMRKKNNAKQK
jgi:[pyruvate, water dikinase]-phosphate phosphotransferase / [pyruvate, water dikinase] kinase